MIKYITYYGNLNSLLQITALYGVIIKYVKKLGQITTGITNWIFLSIPSTHRAYKYNIWHLLIN